MYLEVVEFERRRRCETRGIPDQDALRRALSECIVGTDYRKSENISILSHIPFFLLVLLGYAHRSPSVLQCNFRHLADFVCVDGIAWTIQISCMGLSMGGRHSLLDDMILDHTL